MFFASMIFYDCVNHALFHSFHEDVTPKELRKILENVEGAVMRLEKLVGDVDKKKPAQRGVPKRVDIVDLTEEDIVSDKKYVAMWKDLNGLT